MQLVSLVAFILLGYFASSASSLYDYYRLPTAIKPDHYKLKIITYLEEPNNFTFFGDVSIHFKVLEPTSNITLHVNELNIDETKITLRKSNDSNFHYCGKGIETVPTHNYYIIQLCELLEKDEMYTLKLHFSANLTRGLFGYYRSSYVSEANNETRWLTITQFEPTYARSAFPCFDEPNYKANFTIWLGHNKSLTALSNMPLEKQLTFNNDNNYVWSIFEESVPMSTYLVAYSINDFAYKQSPQLNGSKVIFRTWYKNDSIHLCDFTADVGPKILKFFEDTFGIPFPLPKVDYIAIPDYGVDAMENWGLITSSEKSMLFDPKTPKEFSEASVVTGIGHELAHQWFGNLVTMSWWSDLWLNEGFATYIGNLGVKNYNPEWFDFDEVNAWNTLSVFYSDMVKYNHPISRPVSNSYEIENGFDSISYEKGSVILGMLHMFMGHDAFFEAVRCYLEKHKYQNAEQDDLWAAFTEQARKYNIIKPEYNIKTIMDSWTLQSGYPLLKVTRDYNSGHVHISQQRYMGNMKLSAKEAQKCWWVPLAYTTASDMDFKTATPKAWLECDDTGKSLNLTIDYITSGDEWILLNPQMTGLYRIQYDKENWRLLSEMLKSKDFKKIHVFNRAQLVNDALNLAESGHENYKVTFEILDYLVQEREEMPWTVALTKLPNLYSVMSPFEEQAESLEAYLRYIMTPMYKELGDINQTKSKWSTSNNSHIFRFLALNLATDINLRDCVTTFLKYFREWKSSKNPNSDNTIPKDLRSNVYKIAMRHGDADDWQFLLQRYRESNDNWNKKQFMTALAASRNETNIRSFITMLFNQTETFDKYSASRIFINKEQKRYAPPLILEYLEKNMNELKTSYGTNSAKLCKLINFIGNLIEMPPALASYINFLEINKEFMSKCIDNIEDEIKYKNNGLKWLRKYDEDMKEIIQSHMLRLGLNANEDMHYEIL